MTDRVGPVTPRQKQLSERISAVCSGLRIASAVQEVLVRIAEADALQTQRAGSEGRDLALPGQLLWLEGRTRTCPDFIRRLNCCLDAYREHARADQEVKKWERLRRRLSHPWYDQTEPAVTKPIAADFEAVVVGTALLEWPRDTEIEPTILGDHGKHADLRVSAQEADFYGEVRAAWSAKNFRKGLQGSAGSVYGSATSIAQLLHRKVCRKSAQLPADKTGLVFYHELLLQLPGQYPCDTDELEAVARELQRQLDRTPPDNIDGILVFREWSLGWVFDLGAASVIEGVIDALRRHWYVDPNLQVFDRA